MATKKQIYEIKQKLNDANTRLNDLRDDINQFENTTIKEQTNSLIGKLEQIRKNIQKQYDKLNNYDEDAELDLSEIEKELDRNIESFRNEFTSEYSFPDRLKKRNT